MCNLKNYIILNIFYRSILKSLTYDEEEISDITDINVVIKRETTKLTNENNRRNAAFIQPQIVYKELWEEIIRRNDIASM